jgi:threonylcarbamoyladenosine tRNA methylthiotransferase MtaB
MLTGIHVGQYGAGLTPPVSLWDLIGLLLDEPTGPRIRLSSLDPDEFDERLIELMAHPRLCRHVHLSIQSGSERVLRSMGRRYGPRHIRSAVRAIAEGIPGVAIGADLIAGFPGETEEEHAETVGLVEELSIGYLHVFPFSPRPHTEAAALPDRVPPRIKKGRARELIALGKDKRRTFVDTQVGSVVDAVVVSRRSDEGGCARAVTDNYITVRGPAHRDLYGRLVSARIMKAHGEEVHAIWE